MTNPTPNLDWNLFAMWRGLLATVFLACALLQGGCTSPIVEINRTAPLIQSDIKIQDSANGNKLEGVPL